MSDNHLRYLSIRKAFQQLMPNAGKELEILTALVSGIVGSKRTHYSHLLSDLCAGQLLC
jgi:hypothetical protein